MGSEMCIRDRRIYGKLFFVEKGNLKFSDLKIQLKRGIRKSLSFVNLKIASKLFEEVIY